MTPKSYHQVLNLWFSPPTSPEYLKPKPFWYGKPADDIYVRNHLGETYHAAKTGQLDTWITAGRGEGALALILLLDQVPRNIFRDAPEAYATDGKALSVARGVVERGWDSDLPVIQRRYVYSPFNHSEDLRDQEMSVRLFTALGDDEHLYWARNFYETIKRDGRFKHRDYILGR